MIQFAQLEFMMIRILFKKMLDEKSFKEGKRITIGDVCEATGLSRPTLSRIANTPGYNTNTDVVNALCKYFECTPCELLEYHPDNK